MRPHKLVVAGSCAWLLGGCALGYGVGYSHSSISKSVDKDSTLSSDQAHTVATTYQELRIIDSTGLVLAALVNAGRQYNARAEAIEQAQYRTPDADGKVTVEYSYQPMPIIAGLLTDVRLRLPLGTPSADGVSNPDVEYWGFEVRPEFYTFRPVKSLPMVSALWLSMLAENYGQKTAVLEDIDAFALDLSIGASTSYVLSENLTATGRVGIGFISPLLSQFSGGGWLNPAAEVEVGWRPWHTGKLGLMVSGVAGVGREFAIDRNIVNERVGVNVALTFGSQIPKKRVPASPTGQAQPGQAPLSGGICAGAEQSPECLEVMTSAPEPVKVLFAACAQATANAAQAGTFDTQPGACRTAGNGIRTYVMDNGATLDPAARKSAYVAAAGAFDFAAAGYELSGGRLGADHCAMIEATYNAVIGPDGNAPILPAKVALVNTALTECRVKYQCARSTDGDMTCAPK